jgi:tetratricopeptide (TPR) repeat protein
VDASVKGRAVRLMLAAGLLGAAAVAVYLPALRGEFIWDDDTYLTDNPLIKASDGPYRFWFTTQPPDYYPLTFTLFWLQWRLWGPDPTGYHIVNALLHAAGSIVIWLVLRALKIRGAWFAALVFAVHPVNVASVAWISELKNTLSLVLGAVAILLYLKFEANSDRRWYAFSVGAFVLALLSKTSVVMLPFVLLGCAGWQRGAIDRRDLVRVIPFFALALIFGLVTVWFQYNRALAHGGIVRPEGFLSRLAAAGWAFWFYLYKAILPFRLNMIYPRWDVSPASVISYLPLAAALGLFVIACRQRNTWGRPLLFSLGYFLLMLFPVLGFFNQGFYEYSLVADHWQYPAIIGIIALVVSTAAIALDKLDGWARSLGRLIGVVCIGLLATLTWQRAQVFQTRENLWRDTLKKNPAAWAAHYNLANTLAAQGKLQEATAHYRLGLQFNPRDVNAHNNLGIALARQGQLDEAIAHFSTAVRIKPGHAPAHRNWGQVLIRQGDGAGAVSHFRQAARLKPEDAAAHYELAIALNKTGDLAGALRHFQQAARLDPANAQAHYNAGVLLARQGRIAEAMNSLETALARKPDYEQARRALEWLRAQPATDAGQ